jgi:hypothetical protein
MNKHVTRRIPLRLDFGRNSPRTSLLLPDNALGRNLPAISRFLGASVLALATLIGCSSKEEKPSPPPPGVTIAPVIQKEVSIHQEWVGTTVAVERRTDSR